MKSFDFEIQVEYFSKSINIDVQTKYGGNIIALHSTSLPHTPELFPNPWLKDA